MPKMDAEEAKRILDGIWADKDHLTLTLEMGPAFYTVLGLQMVARNWDKLAESDELKGHMTSIARQMQELLLQAHPEAHEILEGTWFPKEDQDV